MFQLNFRSVSSLYGIFKVHIIILCSSQLIKLAKIYKSLSTRFVFKRIKMFSANGDGEIRTHDPLLARQVLSQLSYAPV